MKRGGEGWREGGGEAIGKGAIIKWGDDGGRRGEGEIDGGVEETGCAYH